MPMNDSATPTMGNLAKLSYSHLAMIDMIIAEPAISQNELALRFRVTPSWISNIMASDAWKAMFAKRREELVDPIIVQSLNSRMESLALRSHEKLMGMLDQPDCPAQVALKALELGARGVEVGGFGRPQVQPPPLPAPDRLEKLADRMVHLLKNPTKETYDAEVIEVKT